MIQLIIILLLLSILILNKAGNYYYNENEFLLFFVMQLLHQSGTLTSLGSVKSILQLLLILCYNNIIFSLSVKVKHSLAMLGGLLMTKPTFASVS